jgi:hypothetical protein
MTTSRLVEQRIRNRLFEYVEWVVESERVPPDLGMNELLNQWEDFVRRPVEAETFPAPVFTEPEVEALKTLDSAWERICSATPETVLDERAAMSTPAWRDFAAAAKATALVFGARGRLSEDVELA